jgi:hypothetical protein
MLMTLGKPPNARIQLIMEAIRYAEGEQKWIKRNRLNLIGIELGN